MSAMTVFYQECPVCGRNLRIAVKYFGRPMSCAHCQGEFVAGPPKEKHGSSGQQPVAPPVGGLLTTPLFSEPHFGEV